MEQERTPEGKFDKATKELSKFGEHIAVRKLAMEGKFEEGQDLKKINKQKNY